jgi:hypothetical protein
MGAAEKIAIYLLKQVNKAARDYDLIEDADRMFVAVCGGNGCKDAPFSEGASQLEQPEIGGFRHTLHRDQEICSSTQFLG